VGRIPPDELERLKREVPLAALAEARGVVLTPHGADLIGRCPFHDDHEPSLVITPAKNLWHCLGACQRGGSVIDWVMQAEGLSFRHAVEVLRTDTTTIGAATTSLGRAKRSTVTRLPAPIARDAADHEVLQQVVAYYHATLTASPEALGYLERRGLRSAELIEHFQLGFANRTLGYRLPARNRQTGAALRGRLEQLGLLRPSGHEHFNGALVIPIVDAAGQVVELYGRRLTDHARPGVPRHLYLPGPLRGVFNVAALASAAELILCEALLDALTFWAAGYREVTASYGVEGFTAEHLTTVQRLGIARLLIAYDADEAGDRAAEALAHELAPHGIACARLVFPRGLDANAYALTVASPAEAFGTLLAAAVPIGPSPAPRRPRSITPSSTGDVEVTAMSLRSSSPSENSTLVESIFSLAADRSDVPDGGDVAPTAEAPPTVAPPGPNAEDLGVTLGDREYRVRGLGRNLSYDSLKVTLRVARGARLYLDTLDLYAARQRAGFVRQAAEELELAPEVLKGDLAALLLTCEQRQDQLIRAALTPKPTTIELSDAERAAALELLTAPHLLDRIVADVARCGLVGETTNTLVGYLAAVSRKLDEPLAVLIQSASAAGKTALMDALLAMIPADERVLYSAVTGQALFYLGETDLAHKLLAIAEDEGVSRAGYALKLLQSEGVLTIASTGKDPTTGRLTTQTYRVQGPVMLLLTTTAPELDEELRNRCLVLTVDEDRAQTRAIHRQQRERQTLAGLLAERDRARVRKLHQDAQRLLRPLLVVNPYARALTFRDDRTRTRRDHLKYLTLIRALALLHQHQRPLKQIVHHGERVEYVEVTVDDIAVANRLAHEVLGRSLDELAPQTRRLLGLLDAMVREACERQAVARASYRFTRRDVRRFTGWSDFQVRTHLDRLISLEYVLVHRGSRGQGFVYELLYDGQGQDGEPFVMGLVDVEGLRASLRHQSDGNFEGANGHFEPPNGEFEGRSSPHRGANEPRVRGGENADDRRRDGDLPASQREPRENAHLDQHENAESYVPARRSCIDRSSSLSSLAAEAADAAEVPR
jgi:DNA primase catalytic core